MSLASSEQRAPHDIAQIIVENLPQRDQLFDRVEIVRPGFLNLTVKPALWQETLKEIEGQGGLYGTSDLAKGRRALIEYVSANPTGPLHVGHGRGAAIGDALARLLGFAGHDVAREFYVNDQGNQVFMLALSVHLRYLESRGREVVFPETGYRGEYIRDLGRELAQRDGSKWEAVEQNPTALAPIREYAIARMLEWQEKTLT